MWERQYQHGRWNGHLLNILSTAIDGGKRLQVKELPYADLPHIKVMGSKARTFNVEVVFVGANSLADSNACINNLEQEPKGELEHPWLGELPLTFETYSQNISTKKGLVTLSLSFVRSGVTPTITATTRVRAREQSSIVEKISAKSFSKDVQRMDVSDINKTQENVTKGLNVLVDITNRLSLSDDALKDINHSINEAFSAVSGLSHEPDKLANSFSTAVSSVASGLHTEPSSSSEAVDNSRSAQALMLNQATEETPTTHYSVQMVTGAVNMSRDLDLLEKEDAFDIASSNKQPAIMQSDLSALASAIDDRIADITKVSTLESMALYDALITLKSNVQSQIEKVTVGSESQRVIQTPRYKPALTIAHDEHSDEKSLTSMNALQHPLFMRGDIAVRVAK